MKRAWAHSFAHCSMFSSNIIPIILFCIQVSGYKYSALMALFEYSYLVSSIPICCIVEVDGTQRKTVTEYIYSAPVSGANEYIEKRQSSISYKQLTREFTRN